MEPDERNEMPFLTAKEMPKLARRMDELIEAAQDAEYAGAAPSKEVAAAEAELAGKSDTEIVKWYAVAGAVAAKEGESGSEKLQGRDTLRAAISWLTVRKGMDKAAVSEFLR